jgi:hypothetical protein
MIAEIIMWSVIVSSTILLLWVLYQLFQLHFSNSDFFYPFQYQPDIDTPKEDKSLKRDRWLLNINAFLSYLDSERASFEHAKHIHDDWEYESEEELLKEAQKHEEQKEKTNMMIHKTHCLNCYTPIKPYMRKCPNCGQKLRRGHERWE